MKDLINKTTYQLMILKSDIKAKIPIDIIDVRPMINGIMAKVMMEKNLAFTIGEIEKHDIAYDFRHPIKVAFITGYILKWVNKDEETIKEGITAALLANLGMYQIPDVWLNGSRTMTDNKLRAIQNHTTNSIDLLKNSGLNKKIKDAILSHHERYDGTGYPNAMVGKDIAELARVIAVADIFDAFISKRPYQDKKDIFQASKELLDLGHGKLDPVFVHVFYQKFISGLLGAKVRVFGNTKAEIIHFNQNYPFEPIIRCEDGLVVDSRINKFMKIDQIEPISSLVGKVAVDDDNVINIKMAYFGRACR